MASLANKIKPGLNRPMPGMRMVLILSGRPTSSNSNTRSASSTSSVYGKSCCCVLPGSKYSHSFTSTAVRGYSSTTTDTSGEKSTGESTGETERTQGAEESQYEYDIKQRILGASLPYVHEHGWTKKALEAGAKEEGLPPIAHGMFPRGGAELVFFFYKKCNSDLSQIMADDVEKANAAGEKIKITEFVQFAVETRLKMVLPYVDIWPQAMAIQTLPQNAVESWSNTLALVDDIWFYAGDRSTDMNWYSKRMTLYAVVKATEIFMLQDKSADKQDTWDFLANRLNDLQKFGSAKRACDQNSDVLKETVKGFAIMGRNVLGFNSRDR